MKNPALWDKLQVFRFNAETGSQPYSVKLAEQEGWEAVFSARVIEEYRRFLSLAHVADHEVTPSVAVYQWWHAHLTFTRAYWDELCGNVLGAPFHHDPCKASEDMDRYTEQYNRTRVLYAAEFGHSAPEDIWPRAQAPAVPDVSNFQKWLFTWGVAGGLLALLALVIYGVNAWTDSALVVFGLMIVVGVLANPTKGRQAVSLSEGA